VVLVPSLLDSALAYVAQAWPVLPVHSVMYGVCTCWDPNCSNPGKHPRTEHGFKDATTDEATIRRWWETSPDSNIGIRTGGDTGPIVLDVDPRNSGNASLAEFEREHGPFPSTFTVETGGGGPHFYFRNHGVPIRSKVHLRPGIDLKADDGYVVAPPSIHASGRVYRLVLDAPLADLPKWLLQLAREAPHSEDGKRPLEALGQGIPEGERHSSLTSLAGTMRRRGMTPEAIEAALLAENRARCRPPLPEQEVRDIALYIGRLPPGSGSGGRAHAAGEVIVREGSRIRFEIHPNGRSSCPLIVERQGSGEPLLVEDVNFASTRARSRFVEALPADVRDEAREMIDGLAPEIVRSRKDKTGREIQGESIELEDPKPWPTRVCGRLLLDELALMFQTFVFLPKEALVLLPLWVVHAHAHDLSFVSPILCITSPEKRCGKTKLLQLFSAFVPRPLMASNITAPALFRTVEKYRPTLLVDEADSFMRDNEDLRGILNSGHSRRSAVVIRTVGDDHEPRQFRTWAPKVIALIGRLPGTLEDRALVVSMRRKTAREKIERLRQDRLHELEPLCQKAARWVDDHGTALRQADPIIPEGLNDRAADNWGPLLAVADEAGGDWPQKAREAAMALTGGSTEGEASARVQALQDIRSIFLELKAVRLSSSQIVDELIKLEDRPWPDWKNGRSITAPQLARLLKPFEIRPKKIRFPEGGKQGYEGEAFAEAFERYLPSLPQRPKEPTLDPEQPEQSSPGAGKSTVAEPEQEGLCSRAEEQVNPLSYYVVPDVPFEAHDS
jgi:uncharacterized protein DUF3631/bifunctional DNA primase/polymerase-like protein/primase-like protein